MIKQFSIVFAMLLMYTGYSQEYFESTTIVKEIITKENISDDDIGHKMFSLLGLENNIDVRKIALDIKARLLVRISRDPDQRLTAKISFTRVSLDGNISLRDFKVDSLLWPSSFTAELTIYNNRHVRDVIKVTASAYGRIEILDLSNYISTNIGDISATISNFKFNYNKTKISSLEELAMTIDYYYSYGKLLSDLIDEHSNHSVNNSQSTERIFVGKIEIDRVNNLIKDRNFSKKLNLNNNDPIGFSKLQKKLFRLTKRAGTLFDQQISNNKADSLKPDIFCFYYCNMSSWYLNTSKLLQPSDAVGFEDVAKIDIIESAKNNLKRITEFYNKNTSTKSTEIYQCISNEFVSMANKVIIDDNYTDALLLLNNSQIIQDWSGIIHTEEYSLAVSTAMDGVSSSYLRVGNVVLSANNLEFASQYFRKADDVFESNQNLINYENLSDTAFKDYIELQHEIALKYIGLGEFETALTRLSNAVSICSKLSNSYGCKLIDTSMCKAHSGKLNLMLDVLDTMINTGQFPDAYNQLLLTAKYRDENSCYLLVENQRFEDLSYSLFLELLQRGEILIDAKQSEMALDNLLKAKSIQLYLNKDVIDLDRLIVLAAEPFIIKLIDEAKYHTWANRMEKADSIYTETTILNEKYFANTNDRINKAIDELHLQMQLRECLSHEIVYSDAIKKARIVIKNKQFSRLDKLLVEAENCIVNCPQCNIQYDEVLELRGQYSSVLEFYKQYNYVSEKLFEKGYNDVIDQYISLLDYYNYHDLFHYDIYFPNLITFITNQKLLNLTSATASYFLKVGDTDKSLEYIKIFKEQGGDPKSIAPLTTDIAKELAKRDNELDKPVNESLHEYTLGDSWYNHFKVAYLKNRIINIVR